jgi:hypothetical protein
MILISVLLILVVLIIFAIIKFFDKQINSKLKPILIIASWLLTFLFGYLIYDTIQEPIRFDELKDKRYTAAVKAMIDLKTAQQAYKSKRGKFTTNLDSLINFIETEKFVIIERRDTAVIDAAKNARYGISVGADGVGGYFKDVVITKELGQISVKDSLFKGSDRYKRLDQAIIPGIKDPVKIEMKTDVLEKGEGEIKFKVPVFEAKIHKNKLLADQNQQFVKDELKLKSVEGINGEEIILGSLEETNLVGNWPKKYGRNE